MEVPRCLSDTVERVLVDLPADVMFHECLRVIIPDLGHLVVLEMDGIRRTCKQQ